MLKISVSTVEGASANVVLQGRAIGPWVKELKSFCERFLSDGFRLTLDLGDVSFIDRDGLLVLRNLVRRETTLVNCPLFLAEQLKDADTQHEASSSDSEGKA